jgi:hypothetical protein
MIGWYHFDALVWMLLQKSNLLFYTIAVALTMLTNR